MIAIVEFMGSCHTSQPIFLQLLIHGSGSFEHALEEEHAIDGERTEVMFLVRGRAGDLSRLRVLSGVTLGANPIGIPSDRA